MLILAFSSLDADFHPPNLHYETNYSDNFQPFLSSIHLFKNALQDGYRKR